MSFFDRVLGFLEQSDKNPHFILRLPCLGWLSFSDKTSPVEVMVSDRSLASQRPFLKLDLVFQQTDGAEQAHLNEGGRRHVPLLLAYTLNIFYRPSQRMTRESPALSCQF